MPHTASLFLKEPGKSVKIETKNLAEGKILKSLTPGQELQLKLINKSVRLFFKEAVVCEITDPELLERIEYARGKKIDLAFFTVKIGKYVNEVLIRAIKPIFLGNNENPIKPFTRHEEVLAEIEQENPTFEEDGPKTDENETLEL